MQESEHGPIEDVRLELRFYWGEQGRADATKGYPAGLVARVLDIANDAIYDSELDTLAMIAREFPEFVTPAELDAVRYRLGLHRGSALIIESSSPGSLLISGLLGFGALSLWLLNQTLGETFKQAWTESRSHRKLKGFLTKERHIHKQAEALAEEVKVEIQNLPTPYHQLVQTEIQIDETEHGENITIKIHTSLVRQSQFPPRPAEVLMTDSALASPPEMVDLPGGSFKMGSEEGYDNERPVHEVELSPFNISRYPVTNAQYKRFVDATGHRSPNHWEMGKIPEGKERHPVVFVSWQDATDFCTWLNEQLGLKEPDHVHLPTEAQWEFAARGESGRTYPWGEDAPSDLHANFDMKVGDTTPVDAYPRGATPEGIHDLAGNVWEWCYDRYGPYAPDKQKDPQGPKEGETRALRGGAFGYYRTLVRCAYRDGYNPNHRADNIGFRVVLSPLL